MAATTRKIRIQFAAFSFAASVIAASAGAFADAGHGHGRGSAIGEPGVKSKVSRTVVIKIQDNFYEPETVEVKKGEIKPGETILVTWRAIPKKIVGPWTVNYYPGEEVLTHLVKNSGGVSYNSTWWNAKGDDLKARATTDLPTKPGQSILPPREAPAPRIPL